jgi:hypothetical protein
LKEPEVLGDTVIWFGEMTVNQPDVDTWHAIDIPGLYNDPVVIMGPLSLNGGHPTTVRVRNVRRTSTGMTSFEW